MFKDGDVLGNNLDGKGVRMDGKGVGGSVALLLGDVDGCLVGSLEAEGLEVGKAAVVPSGAEAKVGKVFGWDWVVGLRLGGATVIAGGTRSLLSSF